MKNDSLGILSAPHFFQRLAHSRNVYRWAGQMLLDASRIRKKQRIPQIAGNGRGTLGVP
jgi:hypothetical protein